MYFFPFKLQQGPGVKLSFLNIPRKVIYGHMTIVAKETVQKLLLLVVVLYHQIASSGNNSSPNVESHFVPPKENEVLYK